MPTLSDVSHCLIVYSIVSEYRRWRSAAKLGDPPQRMVHCDFRSVLLVPPRFVALEAFVVMEGFLKHPVLRFF